MFRATMGPSSEETTVFLRHLVLVILYGWLSAMQGGHPAYQTVTHTEESQKYSYFTLCWAHSRSKHVEIDKYTENKLCTKLVLFTRLDRNARSTKHRMWYICCSCQAHTATAPSSLRTAAEGAMFKKLRVELQPDQYLTVVFVRLIVRVHMLDFTDNVQLPFGRNQSSATKPDRLLTRESHYWNHLLWYHGMVRQMAHTRRCRVKGILLLNHTLRN